jgi:beta-lactamase class A
MKFIRLAALIVALALAGSVCGQLKPSPQSSSTGRGGTANESAIVSDDLLWKKLDGHVGEIVERFDGVMGVAIVDLTDGRTILKNADRVFPTASSIKIAILLELCSRSASGVCGCVCRRSKVSAITLSCLSWVSSEAQCFGTY